MDCATPRRRSIVPTPAIPDERGEGGYPPSASKFETVSAGVTHCKSRFLNIFGASFVWHDIRLRSTGLPKSGTSKPATNGIRHHAVHYQYYCHFRRSRLSFNEIALSILVSCMGTASCTSVLRKEINVDLANSGNKQQQIRQYTRSIPS